MKQEHIKVFTSNSIFVNRLKSLLSEIEIHAVIKDHVNSSQLAGFGAIENSIELYILNTDLEQAMPVIENFRKEIE